MGYTLDIVPQSDLDAARARHILPGSPIQDLLHNKAVTVITRLQQELEKVKPEDLTGLQGRVSGMRLLLSFLHEYDPKPDQS